jgi:hypothetical protein
MHRDRRMAVVRVMMVVRMVVMMMRVVVHE